MTAFDAIAKTLLLGSVAFEGQLNEKGERVIYLVDRVADWLSEGHTEHLQRESAADLQQRDGAGEFLGGDDYPAFRMLTGDAIRVLSALAAAPRRVKRLNLV